MSMNQQRRHLRLSLPTAPRLYSATPSSPFSLSTPSKLRRRHSLSIPYTSSKLHSYPSTSSFFLLLFLSLRSLYSISSYPSFSLLPFSFLLSFLSFSLASFSSSSRFRFTDFAPNISFLFIKSLLFILSLLLKFYSLRFCSASASILTDLSGALFAFSLFHAKIISRTRKLLGFVSLSISLFALSRSWDRVGCFLFGENDNSNVDCGRGWGMSLSFLAGILGHFEKEAGNWGDLNQLGRKTNKVKSNRSRM